MKKAFHALTLTTALTLAGFTAAGAESLLQPSDTSSPATYTSTCWYTCFSFDGSGATHYTVFNVTKAECCGGAAVSCPPGAVPSHPAWGEPAEMCPINEM